MFCSGNSIELGHSNDDRWIIEFVPIFYGNRFGFQRMVDIVKIRLGLNIIWSLRVLRVV